MKKIFGLIIFSLLVVLLPAKAQLIYYDASQFTLLGKATADTETLYERLPQRFKSISRPPVWTLGKNTAGLAVRFASNTTTVSLKWTVLQEVAMNHMTPTGIRGLDLYCLVNGKWTFVNSARPSMTGKETTTNIISNMEQLEREFMLYLPLYDGVVSLEIGVDSLATITKEKVGLPQREKPIVAYGTSILQGGCATRPGMAHTNTLSRWLDREIINLGFSGNGQLDYEIAELIAEVDASIFILDFMPNVSVEQIKEKMAKFYSIIRAKHPTTPIIFIEDPIFTFSDFDLSARKRIDALNDALHLEYNKLKVEDSNILLLSSKDMIGHDSEATVDGIHFTDLGFLRYAEYLYPTLLQLLQK